MLNKKIILDKPKNTTRYIETSNIESRIAIHISGGLRTQDAKLIPNGILIIDCRKNKRLCEYLDANI